jgi:hypothetical protein
LPGDRPDHSVAETSRSRRAFACNSGFAKADGIESAR